MLTYTKKHFIILVIIYSIILQLIKTVSGVPCVNVNVVSDGGTNPSQITWRIVEDFSGANIEVTGDTVITGSGGETKSGCLPYGHYIMYGADSASNGWGGNGKISVVDENDVIYLSQWTGPASGDTESSILFIISKCVDVEVISTSGNSPGEITWGCDYFYYSNKDTWFIFADVGKDLTTTKCVMFDNYYLVGYDSSSNGWDGATIKIHGAGKNKIQYVDWSGPSSGNANEIKQFSIPACVHADIVCTSGDYPNQITWDIKDLNDNLIISNGKGGETISTCLPYGTLKVVGKDSNNNGWNTATLTITGKDGLIYLENWGGPANGDAEGEKDFKTCTTVKIESIMSPSTTGIEFYIMQNYSYFYLYSNGAFTTDDACIPYGHITVKGYDADANTWRWPGNRQNIKLSIKESSVTYLDEWTGPASGNKYETTSFFIITPASQDQCNTIGYTEYSSTATNNRNCLTKLACTENNNGDSCKNGGTYSGNKVDGCNACNCPNDYFGDDCGTSGADIASSVDTSAINTNNDNNINNYNDINNNNDDSTSGNINADDSDVDNDNDGDSSSSNTNSEAEPQKYKHKGNSHSSNSPEVWVYFVPVVLPFYWAVYQKLPKTFMNYILCIPLLPLWLVTLPLYYCCYGKDDESLMGVLNLPECCEGGKKEEKRRTAIQPV